MNNKDLNEKLDSLNNRFMYFLLDLGVDFSDSKNLMVPNEVADMFYEIFGVDVKPVNPADDNK